MSKWQKIDPAEIKVGDRVRVKTSDKPDAYDFTVIERSVKWIGVFVIISDREWYIRKPKKAKPLTRPDEPPVGSFFRVDRTGVTYQRVTLSTYATTPSKLGSLSLAWESITEPGDTLTILKLVEDKPRTNGEFPG